MKAMKKENNTFLGIIQKSKRSHCPINSKNLFTGKFSLSSAGGGGGGVLEQLFYRIAAENVLCKTNSYEGHLKVSKCLLVNRYISGNMLSAPSPVLTERQIAR